MDCNNGIGPDIKWNLTTGYKETCQLCPKGTFSDSFGFDTKCMPCTSCDDLNRHTLRLGCQTADSNTYNSECDSCLPDHFSVWDDEHDHKADKCVPCAELLGHGKRKYRTYRIDGQCNEFIKRHWAAKMTTTSFPSIDSENKENRTDKMLTDLPERTTVLQRHQSEGLVEDVTEFHDRNATYVTPETRQQQLKQNHINVYSVIGVTVAACIATFASCVVFAGVIIWYFLIYKRKGGLGESTNHHMDSEHGYTLISAAHPSVESTEKMKVELISEKRTSYAMEKSRMKSPCCGHTDCPADRCVHGNSLSNSQTNLNTNGVIARPEGDAVDHFNEEGDNSPAWKEADSTLIRHEQKTSGDSKPTLQKQSSVEERMNTHRQTPPIGKRDIEQYLGATAENANEAGPVAGIVVTPLSNPRTLSNQAISAEEAPIVANCNTGPNRDPDRTSIKPTFKNDHEQRRPSVDVELPDSNISASNVGNNGQHEPFHMRNHIPHTCPTQPLSYTSSIDRRNDDTPGVQDTAFDVVEETKAVTCETKASTQEDKVNDEKRLLEVGHRLSKDWRKVAVNLRPSISTDKLEAIQMSNPNDAERWGYDMLILWKQRLSSKDDWITILGKALKRADRTDLVNEHIPEYQPEELMN